MNSWPRPDRWPAPIGRARATASDTPIGNRLDRADTAAADRGLPSSSAGPGRDLDLDVLHSAVSGQDDTFHSGHESSPTLGLATLGDLGWMATRRSVLRADLGRIDRQQCRRRDEGVDETAGKCGRDRSPLWRTLPIAIRLERLPDADRAHFLALVEHARPTLTRRPETWWELVEHGVCAAACSSWRSSSLAVGWGR